MMCAQLSAAQVAVGSLCPVYLGASYSSVGCHRQDGSQTLRRGLLLAGPLVCVSCHVWAGSLGLLVPLRGCGSWAFSFGSWMVVFPSASRVSLCWFLCAGLKVAVHCSWQEALLAVRVGEAPPLALPVRAFLRLQMCPCPGPVCLLPFLLLFMWRILARRRLESRLWGNAPHLLSLGVVVVAAALLWVVPSFAL